MLQLAIWGIALMLVIKALDVLHRQASVARRGEEGAPTLAKSAAAIAVIGAIVLVYLAGNVRSTPALPGLVGYESHDAALEAYDRFKAQHPGTIDDPAGNLNDGLDTMSKGVK